MRAGGRPVRAGADLMYTGGMASKEWQNRIIGHGVEDPTQLLANPLNWRVHPRLQQDALESVLDEVGWVDEVIVNQRTGFILDGHLRVSLALRRDEPTIPVKYVDLSEQEERKVLALLDPMAAVALPDKAMFEDLIRSTDQSPAVLLMLEDYKRRWGMTDYLGVPKDQKPSKRILPLDMIFTMLSGDGLCCVAVDAGWLMGTQSGKSIRDCKVAAEWPEGEATTFRLTGAVANDPDVGCCIASRSGWLYGIRSDRARVCPNIDSWPKLQHTHRVAFIDQDYFHYDHDIHRASVERFKPRYCTARDLMTEDQCREAGIEYYSFEQVMEWAEDLSTLAEHVIVIPKYDCLDAIPEKFVLGYSVPSSHGFTPLPVSAFKGRKVHLLGGSWRSQMAHMSVLGDDVVSADNNQIGLMADYGMYVDGEGDDHSIEPILPRLTNPRYVALTISLGAIGNKLHELYDARKEVNHSADIQLTPAVPDNPPVQTGGVPDTPLKKHRSKK
jgi:hypothetical protein